MGSLDLQKSAGSSVACSRGLEVEEKTYIWAFLEGSQVLCQSSLRDMLGCDALVDIRMAHAKVGLKYRSRVDMYL